MNRLFHLLFFAVLFAASARYTVRHRDGVDEVGIAAAKASGWANLGSFRFAADITIERANSSETDPLVAADLRCTRESAEAAE